MKHVFLFAKFVLLFSFLAISCSEDNTNTPTVKNVNITTISPVSGKSGESVKIYGTGFGNSQGSNFVSFNGTKAINYNLWSDTLISLEIPPNALSGSLLVSCNGILSNKLDFSVIADPEIINVKPLYGLIGEQITISGRDFRDDQASGLLYFNDSPVSPLSWSDTKIVFKIPQTDQVLSNIKVSVSDSTTNAMPFIVGIGGNPASHLTGLWKLQTSFYDTVFYYYIYLTEENGKITGNGIQYMSAKTGDIYETFTVTGTLSTLTVNMSTSMYGFGFFSGKLSADYSSIDGKAQGEKLFFTRR